MNQAIATIPSKISGGEELVVIPRSLYRKLSARQEELRDALAKVQRGRQAFQQGKTYTVDSPRELLSVPR